MPQTAAYTLANPAAVPGLLMDGQDDVVIAQYPAAIAIPFGLGVELDATGLAVRLPLGTGQDPTQFAGISVYSPTDEPGGYAIGDMVRVLRKGRIAVTTYGTAVAATDALTAANLNHQSVTATNRGKFTKAALAAGADAEVGVTGAKWIGPAGAIANLAFVELNLP